jgi:hypothetical protein
MDDLKVSDLRAKAVTFAGIVLQGWADGDAMSIEFDGPAFNFTPGGDGENIRTLNPNRSAIITFRLQPTSSVNDQLSAIHNADLKAPNGAGIAPFQYEDLQGSTVLKAGKAYIENPPNETIGTQPKPREWKIRASKLEGVWGGN